MHTSKKFVCMTIFDCGPHTHARTHAHMHACTHTHMHMMSCVCVCVCVCVCMCLPATLHIMWLDVVLLLYICIYTLASHTFDMYIRGWLCGYSM